MMLLTPKPKSHRIPSEVAEQQTKDRLLKTGLVIASMAVALGVLVKLYGLAMAAGERQV